jgi:hypothetical protein
MKAREKSGAKATVGPPGAVLVEALLASFFNLQG